MGFESTCSKNLEKPYGDTQSTFEARLITRLTRELAKIQAAGFPEAVGLGRPGLCALKAARLSSVQPFPAMEVLRIQIRLFWLPAESGVQGAAGHSGQRETLVCLS